MATTQIDKGTILVNPKDASDESRYLGKGADGKHYVYSLMSKRKTAISAKDLAAQVLKPDTGISSYYKQVTDAVELHTRSVWVLGDLVAIREQYGVELSELAGRTGLTEATLRVYESVALKFNDSIRKQYSSLSHSHFQTVMACSTSSIPKLLEKAKSEKLTVPALRSEVAKTREQAPSNPSKRGPKPKATREARLPGQQTQTQTPATQAQTQITQPAPPDTNGAGNHVNPSVTAWVPNTRLVLSIELSEAIGKSVDYDKVKAEHVLEELVRAYVSAPKDLQNKINGTKPESTQQTPTQSRIQKLEV